MEKPGEPAGTVLVLVSDGKGLVSKLTRHGIHALACKNPAGLSKRFDSSTDAIILREQSLLRSKPAPLLRALKSQPPWSDVHVILLTTPAHTRDGSVSRDLELL